MNRRHKSSSDLFLGVDGGGTKTHAVLISSKGTVIGEGHAGPSNPLRVGVDTAVSNIQTSLNKACDEARHADSDIDAAVIGLAGVRRADLRETVASRLKRGLRADDVSVVTDAEIALYGTTLGEPGVVLIAGTGSICFGKNSSGKTSTAGGWGPLAGDEGGGVSIAKQALQAIAKASDGRGRQTKLSDVAAEYFRASTVEDLIVAIYSPMMDNKRLAGFAKCVAQAAAEGDEIAIELLAVAGFELGLAAYAVINNLGLADEKVPIGMVGSIFKAEDLIKKPLLETVRSFAPEAFLQVPKLAPANAAAVLALNTAKVGLES